MNLATCCLIIPILFNQKMRFWLETVAQNFKAKKTGACDVLDIFIKNVFDKLRTFLQYYFFYRKTRPVVNSILVLT